MSEPMELRREQCVALLRAGLVGRVAVCTPVGPHIVPVNYGVVDDTIVIRTTPYSLLGTQARASTVAVEVDHFDYERQRGWSVVARGRADVIASATELDRVRAVWEPLAWAAGARNLFLRIPWTELTGRQLGSGWDPAEALPVQRVV